jgi:hypothetical protein
MKDRARDFLDDLLLLCRIGDPVHMRQSEAIGYREEERNVKTRRIDRFNLISFFYELAVCPHSEAVLADTIGNAASTTLRRELESAPAIPTQSPAYFGVEIEIDKDGEA